jgi:ParB/RepB/Spo0J family partition protein
MAKKKTPSKTTTTSGSPEPRFDPHLDLAAIAPSPHQTRRFREDDPALAELAVSIAQSGVIEPVVVRPAPAPGGAVARPKGAPAPKVGYLLVAGERRVRASRLAGRTSIPAMVHEAMTDAQALEITVIENLQREGLEPIPSARAVRLLMEQRGGDVAAVSAEIGKSESWVARRMALNDLVPAWLEAAEQENGQVASWGVGHLELVARLEPDVQARLLEEVSEQWWNGIPTVARLRSYIAQRVQRSLDGAPWRRDDAELVPEAGACSDCPARTSQQPHLWEVEGAKDLCLRPPCYEAKRQAFLARRYRQLVADHGADNVYVVVAYQGGGEGLPAGARTIERYAVEKVRKGSRGAIAALDPQEPGKVTWCAPPARGGGKAARPKGAPTPLPERRAALNRRREKLAVERLWSAILRWIQDDGCLPSADALCRLVAAIGTSHKEERASADVHALYGNGALDGALDPKTLKAHVKKKKTSAAMARWTLYADNELALRVELWVRLQYVLAARMKYGSWVDTHLQLAEALALAGMVGKADDAEEIRAGAFAELADPRSWALLNEDGTPRAKKKKKAAAKMGAKATAKKAKGGAKDGSS